MDVRFVEGLVTITCGIGVIGLWLARLMASGTAGTRVPSFLIGLALVLAGASRIVDSSALAQPLLGAAVAVLLGGVLVEAWQRRRTTGGGVVPDHEPPTGKGRASE